MAMSRSCSPAPFGVVLPHARFCLGAEELRVLLWLWPRCHTPWQPFGSGWEQLGGFAAPRGCLEFPPWALIQLNEPPAQPWLVALCLSMLQRHELQPIKVGERLHVSSFCASLCWFVSGPAVSHWVQSCSPHCHHQTQGLSRAAPVIPKLSAAGVPLFVRALWKMG